MSKRKILIIVTVFLVLGLTANLMWPQSIKNLKLDSSAKLTVYNTTAEKYDELHGPVVDQSISLFNRWLQKNEYGWERWFGEAPPQIQFVDGETKISIWSNAVVIESPKKLLEKKIDAAQSAEIVEILTLLNQR